MKCKKCGYDNPKGAKKCLACSSVLEQDLSTDKIIMIVICVLAAALIAVAAVGVYNYNKSSKKSGGFGTGGGGGYISMTDAVDDETAGLDTETVLEEIADINGGVLPEFTFDDNGVLSFIDGQYTRRIVTNYASAIQSLNDIKPLLQIESPVNEYVGKEMYTCDTNKLYKLQQVHNGVPVYKKECIVETAEDGTVLGLMCDYDPGIDISTSATIKKTEAEKTAMRLSGALQAFDSTLYVYTINGDPVLVWGVEVGNSTICTGTYFINASDGSLVDTETNFYTNTVYASGTDMNNETRTFNASGSNGTYQMADETRGITVYDANNSVTGSIVSSASYDSWDNAAAVSAMSNISIIVDYYENVFNSNAFTEGKLNAIKVFVNYTPQEQGNAVWENAASSTSIDNKTTYIFIGSGNGYARSFDIAAHEFTHSVISATCDLAYVNQSGAISEAYADIMGSLIQNLAFGTDEWTIGEELDTGASRSLSSPRTYQQPNKVDGTYMQAYCTERHDHSAAGCDSGGVHTNSGIINKAAYLMYQKGFTDKQELATLFSRSMNYLNATADFKQCRAALIHAAKMMNLSAEKQTIISDAFSDVGIINDTQLSVTASKGTLSGSVADAILKTPLSSAEITAERSDSSIGGGTSYTDSDGNFTMRLAENTYKLTISAAGYRSCFISGVDIASGESTYLENTILLTEVEGNPLSKAGGRITNAVSGESVANVIIQFRADWGNTTGDYVKNSLGNDIRVMTDDNGEFFTDELTYGYYTAEVSKDGYSTQYVNLIATESSEVSLMQDIVLSPASSGDEYRITLEWEENPRDEDAHIYATFPDGSKLHVFYEHQDATVNGSSASLDHDDMYGNGFETVTLSVVPEGTYHYYVHHFSGEGQLSTSNAMVKVYQGDVMIKKYNVPVDQGNGKCWNVFDIVNGEIVTVNTITDNLPEEVML